MWFFVDLILIVTCSAATSMNHNRLDKQSARNILVSSVFKCSLIFNKLVIIIVFFIVTLIIMKIIVTIIAIIL